MNNNEINNSIFNDPKLIEELNNQIINEEDNYNPLSTISKTIEKSKNIEKEIEYNPGYTNIPLNMLPSNGIFYPSDLKILIRPLITKEIKYYSSIDESDNIDINHRLNWILNCGIKFNSNIFPNFSFKNLLQLDRFSLILSIREITFLNFPSKLITTCKCPYCKLNQDVEILTRNVGYLEEDTFKNLQDCFNEQLKCFNFTRNNETLNIWFPSVYNSDFISNYLNQKSKTLKTEDKLLISNIPYLVSPSILLDDNKISKLFNEIENYDIWKYTTMIRMIEHLENNYCLNIYYICSNNECGKEVATSFTFPGGFKTLFIPMLSDLIN